MSLLGHIQRLNAHDPAGFRPLEIAGAVYGRVRPAVADVLLGLGDAFEATATGLRLSPDLDGFDARSAALEQAAEAVVAAGFARKMRSELYGVANRWGAPPVAAINRGVVAAFGFRSYGVHMNGWRRRADGEIELWLGVRARDKAIAPGQLDNMVAGGQPLGLGLMENLIKEADEEASVPAALAAQSRPVGCLSYVMENDDGLKPDVQFCYDLEVPHEFTPINADGETEKFITMTARDALARVRDTDDFKFNVNLVLIDFCLRHGVLTPDDEPDYEAIARGLHGGDAA